jgi:muramoyltetrapeptide carboxypeptidase LdcA involved in peptidoglycan recycling
VSVYSVDDTLVPQVVISNQRNNNMKLTSVLLATSLLTISGMAYASDTTQVGHIAAHETHAFPVELPSGTSRIEVWDEDNQVISCAFVPHNKAVGKVVETGKTTRCVFLTNPPLTLPVEAHVRVSNDNDTAVVYHMVVHNDQ